MIKPFHRMNARIATNRYGAYSIAHFISYQTNMFDYGINDNGVILYAEFTSYYRSQSTIKQLFRYFRETFKKDSAEYLIQCYRKGIQPDINKIKIL